MFLFWIRTGLKREDECLLSLFPIILSVESYFVFLPLQHWAFWSHMYPRVSLFSWTDCGSLSWLSSSGIFQAMAFSIFYVYSTHMLSFFQKFVELSLHRCLQFHSPFLSWLWVRSFYIFIHWKVHRLMVVLSWSIWWFLCQLVIVIKSYFNWACYWLARQICILRYQPLFIDRANIFSSVLPFKIIMAFLTYRIFYGGVVKFINLLLCGFFLCFYSEKDFFPRSDIYSLSIFDSHFLLFFLSSFLLTSDVLDLRSPSSVHDTPPVWAHAEPLSFILLFSALSPSTPELLLSIAFLQPHESL